jgi:hypothetical protein
MNGNVAIVGSSVPRLPEIMKLATLASYADAVVCLIGRQD